MEVHILASGSSGNCIAVRSGSTTILIDAGIPKTKIERRLLDAGIRPDKIDAIFITHAHKDHVKGLPLANKYRIPVYASEGEWRDIRGVDSGLRVDIPKEDGLYEPFIFDMGEFGVIPFGTHHDAYEPLGYRVVGEQTVSICLDTGHVDDEMLNAMAASDIYIIEANHDPDLVAVSNYPESVKERILSDRGHLSNQQAAEVLAKLIRGRGERIYLTHLSEQNNMPALALATVEAELRRRGFENGKHYFCEVV
jgi:phosphoribosyl 1,2-cyclic phosphodiesterase